MTLTAITHATAATAQQAHPAEPIGTTTPTETATPGGASGWRRWAGRAAAVLSACWHRVSAWFGVRRASPTELRAAEKQRRKGIRRRLKERR